MYDVYMYVVIFIILTEKIANMYFAKVVDPPGIFSLKVAIPRRSIELY
jgi:hypothetical protein